MAHPEEMQRVNTKAMFNAHNQWQERLAVPRTSTEVLWHEGQMPVRAAAGDLAVRTYADGDDLCLLQDVRMLARVKGDMPNHLEQGVAASLTTGNVYTVRPHRSIATLDAVTSEMVDGMHAHQLGQSLDALAHLYDAGLTVNNGIGLTRYGVFVPRPRRLQPGEGVDRSVRAFARVLAYGGLVSAGPGVETTDNRIEAAHRILPVKRLGELVTDRATDTLGWEAAMWDIDSIAEHLEAIAGGAVAARR